MIGPGLAVGAAPLLFLCLPAVGILEKVRS